MIQEIKLNFGLILSERCLANGVDISLDATVTNAPVCTCRTWWRAAAPEPASPLHSHTWCWWRVDLRRQDKHISSINQNNVLRFYWNLLKSRLPETSMEKVSLPWPTRLKATQTTVILRFGPTVRTLSTPTDPYGSFRNSTVCVWMGWRSVVFSGQL